MDNGLPHRKGYGLWSALLLVDLEIQYQVLLAVKTGDRAGRRLGPVFLGMNLVVSIRIETTETIVAGVIADVAANDVAAGILQEDHRGGHGRFPLIGDEPVDHAELGFVLGILLRYSNRCKQD